MKKMPFVEKRPDSLLTNKEMMFLTASAILPFENVEIYKAFVRPEWAGTINKLRLEMTKFLECNDAILYLQDIDSVTNTGKSLNIKRNTLSAKELENKIQDATLALGAILCDKVLDTKNIDQQKDIEIFLKNYANTMKDAEVAPPLRILSEQCSSCRYRLFVEENYDDTCSKCAFKNNGQADAKNEANNK